MSENLLRNRQLCLEHAKGFLDAAERIGTSEFPHIVYHLSLLALEEVGKASMISGQIATGETRENRWIEKAYESHRRKLQWAVWSPIDRIDLNDFESARDFAERAHSMRLASLYVDAGASLTDVPARDVVGPQDAQQALELARARLEFEGTRGTPDPHASSTDELLHWFLECMAEPNQARQLLSKAFVDRYHALGCDARAWVAWAREEIIRREREAHALLQAEFAKPGAPAKDAKPKWRANATVYTPSHSLRSKVLQRWNAQIESVQLLWTGKKDRFTLQLTLSDNAPLSQFTGRVVSLAKLVVACLNIGSIGYFWFERPGFERPMFDDIRDLENDRRMEIGSKDSFWGDHRKVALTNELIDHAIRCMMAFAPLAEAEAEPVFRPYYDGLALIAKSDLFYNFNEVARHAFIASLAGALAHYEGWDPEKESFRACFDRAFEPIMPVREDRDQMFRTVTREGDPSETSLVNLRSAKQLTDLYLIQVGRRTWREILDKPDRIST